MPRPVEAARGEDVRAGPGEGRDPHEGALVSGLAESASRLMSCGGLMSLSSTDLNVL